MKQNHIKISAITMILLAGGCIATLHAGQSSYPQDPATDPNLDIMVEGEEVDSIDLHRQYVDSLVEVADASYKNVVTLQTGGEDKGIIMPAVYQCYFDNLKAMRECEPQSEQWSKCRSTLVSINPLLEAGAFYYSSIGDNDRMQQFAQTYIDGQLLDEMKNIQFKRNAQSFPTIAYIAASRAYNDKEFDRAIEYFKVYFSTGAAEQRQQVFIFMTQACMNVGNYDLAHSTIREALKQYPTDEHMLMLGIQVCVDGGHGESLQDFLTPMLALRPNDEQLLNLQGQLYEDNHEYAEAVEIYNKIDEMSPNKLSVAKHLSLGYYNIAVNHFNESINLKDEKQAKKARRMARDYFTAATLKLENVLASDPLAVRYIRALGVSYLCLEEKEKFQEINRQLTALGEDALSDVFMPPMMTYNEQNRTNLDYVIGGNRSNDSALDAPLFTDFSRDYILNAMQKWSVKGEFEKDADYLARVNDVTIKNEVNRLSLEAQDKYLEQYGKKLRLSDLKLMPYDASNETFRIETSNGDITLRVPLKDNEAERFKSNWDAMQFRNPQYMIENDRVQIASITVQSPDGKTYSYDRTKDVAYTQSNINIDYEGILSGLTRTKTTTPTPGQGSGNAVTVTKKSDVDINIPHSGKTAANTFALIIANENYHNVSKVQSALHDGEVFAEYCQHTLGLPESNIRVVKDATYGRMMGEIKQFQNTINSFGGKADAIIYYAGHGLPDETTKDAYLLPTDGVPSMTSTSYSLETFYKELSDMNSNAVMVFLDACFSGQQRDGNMLYSARAVAIAHKEAKPTGNMFVLSAASGGETAMPYTDKNHGLFTYYLLKKLQDSKGNLTLKELSDYVIASVTQQSNVINKKQQTPTVNVTGNMIDLWKKKKMAP